jgi:hypothetical protein
VSRHSLTMAGNFSGGWPGLPFEWKGIGADNGSELISARMLACRQSEELVFTRSRSCQKNDDCHVEQKDFTAVRDVVDHRRHNRPEELEVPNAPHGCLRLYLDFFHPHMSLTALNKYLHKRCTSDKLLMRQHGKLIPHGHFCYNISTCEKENHSLPHRLF